MTQELTTETQGLTDEVIEAGGIDPVLISPTVPEERAEKILADPYERRATATVGKIDEAKRTVELTFGSEFAGARWFGLEKLEMTPKAADLKRLNKGGALLSEHDTTKQIGVVERAWIGTDRRAHAVVRFSRKPFAEEEFRDVVDGIRTNVSFRYRILKYETTKGTGGAPDTVTATRWEALEVSLVSVAFDPTVGTDRAAEVVQDFAPETVIEETREETPVAAEITEEKRGIEKQMDTPLTPVEVTFAREDAILELGKRYGVDAKTTNRFAIDPKQTVESFRTHLMTEFAANDTPDLSAVRQEPSAALDLSAKDVQRYSISRAILAQADGNWDKAGFERECHDAIVERGVTPQSGGFLVPTEVQRNAKVENQRDLSVGGGLTTGGALVGTDHLPGSFIEVLRSKMKTIALGVQMMSGLVGNPSVPRQDGSATGYWVNEGVAPTESQLSLGQLGMSPKTCGAVTEFTRQLLVQSAPSIDNLVNRDLAAVLARTIDSAIIQGTGANGQPRGILNTTGVSEVSMIGGSFAFADAVAFETAVAEADAADAVAWLARPSVIGALKTRTKVAASTFPIYLIEGGQMNGYPVEGTTQMPASTLIFGDFTTIILGEWGVLEIEANRLGSGFRAGNIEVRGLHMVDVAVRYPQALKKLTAFA